MKIHTTNKLSRWLTYSLCGLLSLQPALANVVIDNRSGNTSKTQAGNGVEVVNIATPNNKGLSHNQYKKFDVDPQGLILNNSIQPLSRSQLGGILQNNPNLNGQAANVILNEVTGANRSQLEGYTEVFGQQANVILANPYGITCDGCGFINTPRVTLSTGAPDIQDGLVSGFDVAEGSVTIEGLGLDASQQTYFDIITRTAEINASIHANGLTLVTGTNHVGYQTNQATPTNTTSSGSKPALAIDSSSLGGMYAGRISLVATKQGVGVNVGNLVSNIGDLSISSNGDIVLGNASSAQDLSLNTLQNLTLADTQTAQKDASLTAQRIQVEQSQIVVDGTLSLHTDNLTLTDTDIETQQIETEIHDITVDEQSKMSAASITMAELSSLNNHGQVYARDTLSIQGHSTRLTEDGLLTASNVIIQSPQLTIDTRLQTDNTQIVSSQQLIITDDAQLEATGDVELTSELLDLIGDIVANNQIDIAVNAAASIQGTLISKNVNLAANDAQMQGALHANERLTVTAETLTNTGSMTSSNTQQINVESDILNAGWVYAADSLDFRVQGTLINQQGEILSNGDVQIRGHQGNGLTQSFHNASGALHANQSLAIYASTILNKPTTVDFKRETTNGDYAFASVEGFSVGWGSSYTPQTHEDKRNCNAFGRSCEHWKVSQDKEVTLLTQTTNRTLTSNASSQMTADGSITLVSEKITNELGLIHAGQDLDISTEALVNRGYTTGQYRDYSLYKHYRTEGDPIRQFDYIRLNTQTQTLNEETHHSTIAAGGSVTIEADSQVNNSNIREMDASDITGLAAQPIQQQTAATLAYPIPSGANGLFIYQPEPLGKYLIETNPLLTNMGQFLGSDYFINRVGFNPQTDVKFLGDAFYDSKIISQAIFEQTGLRYLNQSIGSQLEQMQQLIDAAALQKNALNLSAGVALSADQIANLTQDIVWYEDVIINGQTVLAPKLYLAQVTLNNLSQGALIAAADVTLNADNMTNSGRVSADSLLNLSSAHSIDNLAGTLTSNGNLSLLAEQDIINLSGDIQGNSVSLTATRGDIVNETLATTLTSTLGSSRSTLTKLGKAASIRSAGDLALNAGNNIKNLAADISSQGNLDLTAGQSLIVSAKENTLNASGSFGGEASTSRIGSSVTAEGSVSLNAGKDITITASQLASQQTLSLEAGNNVTVEAALNEQSDNTHLTNYTSINRSEQHQGSTLTGNDVTVKASNDATLSGSAITAEQSAAIEAKGDVNILAVNDSQYHYDQTISNKSFGRSKTTTNETYREQVKGSAIQAGQDVRVNAQNLDTVITAGGDSDINLIGSELSAGGQVELSADGVVKLAAQTYKQFERHETIKKGFGGLSGRNQGSLDDATLLNSSYLINSGNTSITAGRDIGVIASEVTSGGEVNLNAVEDVLIAAGDVLKKSQQWDEKMSFLSGGNLFEMEKKRQGEETSTAQSSSIHSGGSLTVNAGLVKVVGSELNADHNVSLTADTGDVEILAAQETTKAFESEEKLSISLGDGLDGVSVEDGQIKISLGDASYDKVKQQSDALNHKESVVKAQNDLAVNAESSILVEGSTLASDSDGNHQGDLSLTAKDDVTIKAAVDTLSEQREEIHGKAEASLVVQHQAVEVAKAALALKEATKKLKQAKADFKQYKKGLDSLEATLATLEQEYKAKKPGVIYEDIEELQDLVSEGGNTSNT
ncbi:hemagglutinin repeat-containing protein [Vibrio brasiliensis]|uniref:two-partner secretion domain-containing protein n=1 Tax=Vibrio brasiliensis TaxID=170652 RepID=UPI001EFDD843|nr:hemagglutinin repeat-containing protein [Vibrio brasiliensis]